ncbi:hypothetical protein DDW11_01325 [Sulfolobus sp. SCGC AB-777_G06]|nr:hypothetical protein DDW11_01325 [Sulfolobus sp. SCGC AB-777_G06]
MKESTAAISPLFRSDRIKKLFEELLMGEKTASDLAEAIQVESREIYPRLKRYFNTIISVRKEGRINKYSINPRAVSIVKEALKRGRDVLRKAEELMRRVTGRELDEVEKKVIEFLIFYMKRTGRSYLEGGLEGNIAELISRAIKVEVEDVARAILSLSNIGILYLWPSSVAAKKVRLSKALL